MLALTLIWFALGALVGAAAILARLIPKRWGARRWLATPALGGVGALAGGWLSAPLVDHLFASCVAVWLSIVVVGVAGLLSARKRSASAAPRRAAIKGATPPRRGNGAPDS